MKEPLISVIIAAYKIEQYLGKCLDSILSQTYTNLEVIIVNDGSPDKVHEIALEYVESDCRVKLLDKENGGLSDARNAGLDVANGEYIVIIDGDDYIEQNMIELMYNRVIETSSDVCMCGINIINECASSESVAYEMEEFEDCVLNQDSMFDKLVYTPNWNYVVAWNKLYKKEIFDNVRYKKGKIHEDEFIIHYIVKECSKVCFVSEKLYNYIQRENSITHTGYKIAQLDIIEAVADRAEFFLKLGNNARAYRMLQRMRTVLLEGTIRTRKNRNIDIDNRLKKLHYKFRELYCQIDLKEISSNRKYQMKILYISLKLALLTSRKYWKGIN